MIPSLRLLQVPSTTHLIAQAQHLSSKNLLLPLRQTIDSFLSLPNLTSNDFNQFLRALSNVPYRSAEAMRNVERVLDKMGRQKRGEVEGKTWIRLILGDGLGTGKGEGALRLARKIHDTIEEPDETILKALLRVYAKHGALTDAQKCFDALVALRGGVIDDPHLTTAMLRAFVDKDSARAFFKSLPSLPSTASPVYMHTTGLHIAARDRQTSTYDLIQSFLLISTTGVTTPVTYTVLIQGLLLRKQFRKASIFFHKLMKSGLLLDNPALAVGLEALTRNGQPHVAFQILEKYFGPSKDKAGSPYLTLSTLTFNAFLVSLNRIGRPDISIRLFEHLDILYGPDSDTSKGCLPNSQTLSIILQSCRLGIKLDASPSTPKLRPLPPFGSTTKSITKDRNKLREQAVNVILSALGHPSRGSLRRYVNATYRGVTPASYASTLFHTVIDSVLSGATTLDSSASEDDGDDLGGLRWDLDPPDEDTKHISDIGLTISHLSKLRDKLVSPPPADSCLEAEAEKDGRYISDIGMTMEYVRKFAHRTGVGFRSMRAGNVDSATGEKQKAPTAKAKYPSIIPTNSNFFDYLFFLACLPPHLSSSSSPPDPTTNPPTQTPTPTPSDIPQTFSLMHHLGIQPSNSTLALGLVAWWELSVRATSSDGEWPKTPPEAYIQLADFLRSWVGESRVPHWRTLEKWRVVLEKARVAKGDR